VDSQTTQTEKTGSPAEIPADDAPQPQPELLPDEAAAPADDSAVSAPPATQTINFANKNQARLVVAAPASDTASLTTALGIAPPEIVLLLFGDTEQTSKTAQAHLVQLFSRGIARTLAQMNALIIDSGRDSGISALAGQSVEDRGRKTPLLGIAPAALVTYPGKKGAPNAEPLEPNHTHFLLTDGAEWGEETDTVFELADSLAETSSVAALVIGGDDTTKKQVLQTVRRGWPVIALKGSGGVTDQIVKLDQQRPQFISDPDLAEIIIDGKIYAPQTSGSIGAFQRLLEQLLRSYDANTRESTLEIVWQRFAQYDLNANRQQKEFNRRQILIIALGIIATFLALVQATINNSGLQNSNAAYQMTGQILHVVLLLIPISITALIAAANRFSAGNKWILLRASAESLKKEIYRYRTRAEIYSDRQTRTISREMKLHRKEETLSRKLMQTEVNVSALRPYSGPIPPKYGAADGDDGFSFLSPERYLTHRLEDQINYYQTKTIRLEQRLKRLQWLIYIFGGLGTLLVALQFEVWIAFTTAVVSGLTTYLEYRRIEDTLMRYNQTAAELSSIRSWWITLSPEEQADPANLDKLVGQTETTIYSEHAAWVQEMQDAMAELRAEQTEENKKQPAAE